MSIANKALVHRWFEEVWNWKRESAIREILHPEAILYGLGDSPTEPCRGAEEFVPFWKKFVSAFPNISVTVEAVVAEYDLITLRCHVRGKHTGDGLGIPPTNATVSI